MTPKKRIAIVMTSAMSFNSLMRGQLEFLQSEGAKLDLYSGGPSEDLLALKERNVGRVCYVPFRRDPSLLLDLACFIWLTTLFAVRRYDSVVYSTPKAMFLGSLAAFVTGQPHRIAWVRGRAYENHRGRARQFYLLLDRLTFRVSHEILFVSPSLAQAYREDGFRFVRNAFVIGYGSSNGVDLERFRPSSDTARSAMRVELGLSPLDFAIVVVGRIRKDKGAREILELSRRLADISNLKFLMIGKTEERALGPEIERQLNRLLTFGPVPDVERFFQIADLHLFLSHREGFGNVALEAAAAGVPTFAFDVVGVRDSVIDGSTGRLFAFGDLDSLEKAIRAAVADPATLKKSYSGARETVAERFGHARVWQGYSRLFHGGRRSLGTAQLAR